MQACFRGAIQRPLYRKALADAIEEAKLENQIRQRKLEEAEQRRVEAEKKAEENVKTVVVYQPKEGEEKKADAPVVPTAPLIFMGQLTAQQQALMDESGKMLENQRKEVFKLRSQNSQLRADFEVLKENNQRLIDANASAGASFAALNQHTKQLSKTNNKLQEEVIKYKDQAHKQSLALVELKEELKMK